MLRRERGWSDSIYHPPGMEAAFLSSARPNIPSMRWKSERVLGCNSIDILNFGRKIGHRIGPRSVPNSVLVHYRTQKNSLQNIFKKEPGRIKQNSQGTAGRNFTKPRTSHFFFALYKLRHFSKVQTWLGPGSRPDSILISIELHPWPPLPSSVDRPGNALGESRDV